MSFLNLDYIILQLLKEMPRQLKVTDLAEDLQEQQYEERPIQNFGMHMLQSMGFTKEKGIGKSNKTSLQDVLVLKPRPKGLGLGAQQEKQKPKDPFSPGDYILITEKEHKDLTGIILEVRQDKLLVELFRSKSQIQISKSKVKILTAEEVKQFEEKEKKEEQPQKKKRLKWVVPGLRLKIVDKNSSFYLKKVVVHDLISDRQFECVYDGDYGKSMIRNLREKDVQTVIPKTGEPVLILKGPHQGQKAQVFQRDKKSQKLTVQTMTELELITLAEDDVCEFVEL